MAKSVILCVDDEDIILNSLKSELREAFVDEFIIETAVGGEDALEVFQELLEDKYEIPVVISDYIMPDIKGDELLKRIHEISPTTRKIMLTGQASMEGVTNAINHAKLYRYISKPWDTEDLIITVKEAAKSYFQESYIERQNRELAELNASLEKKVEERTKELHDANKMLNGLVNQINQQKQIIEKKNFDITSSINYAKRLQDAMLPRVHEIQSFLPESFVLFKPRDIVSGDFFWFSKAGNRCAISAADCTGHGIPGSFISMMGNVMLNKLAEFRGIISPDIMLNHLDKDVRTTLREEETNIRDGMDIALITIDLDWKMLEFSGAKNPMIYFQDGKMTVIKGNKMPIGGLKLDEVRRFDRHVVDISKPTTFYIFTDGYQDQFGGDKGGKLMVGKFRQILQEIHQLPMDEQKEILDRKMKEWVGTTHRQIDDILVIGARIPS
jgi:serine phosphatase RsbU (regulator of sigma subunit)